jgi:hypothetical protein
MEYKRIVHKGQAYNWDGRYYSPVGGCVKGKKRLHQAVWEERNGKIPKGYYIHHKDSDRTNNKINNLELVSPKEHNDHHWKLKWSDPIFRKKTLEHFDNIRPLTKIWHASPEGHKWHVEHAINQWTK